MILSGVRRDNMERYLRECGRLIGVGDWGEYYVLCGTVFLLDATTCTNKGDYYEFCDKLRRGYPPDFVPKNFHLAPARKESKP